MGSFFGIAGTGPAEEYVSILNESGFTDFTIEGRSDALKDMIKEIRHKLLGLRLVAGLRKLGLGELDINNGKKMLKGAADLIEKDIVGYTLITVRKMQAVTEDGGKYDSGINR